MKRSASEAGLPSQLTDEAAKFDLAARDTDGGGLSALQSPASMSPELNTASPAGSDGGGGGVNVAEKSSQEPGKPLTEEEGSAKKRKESKAVLSSPQGSDDDGDGKVKGGRGGTKGGGGGGAGAGAGAGGEKGEAGHDDEDDEEERMENIEFGKFNAVDPGRMQQVLNKFTPEQMSRYECYRRSGFQRANMRRLLASVAGCPISIPMTIVMSGIAKMFVGEIVETGRVVMTERKDVGPIRPCHVREAYRRLKVEGKVPSRGRPRLFR